MSCLCAVNPKITVESRPNDPRKLKSRIYLCLDFCDRVENRNEFTVHSLRFEYTNHYTQNIHPNLLHSKTMIYESIYQLFRKLEHSKNNKDEINIIKSEVKL